MRHLRVRREERERPLLRVVDGVVERAAGRWAPSRPARGSGPPPCRTRSGRSGTNGCRLLQLRRAATAAGTARGLGSASGTGCPGPGRSSRTGPALSMSSVMPSVGPPGTSPALRIASIAASSSISKNSAALAGSIRRTISRHIQSSERDSPTGSIAACWSWRNGWSGVAVRSVFSYQVVAGRTTSAHFTVSVIWWSTTTIEVQPGQRLVQPVHVHRLDEHVGEGADQAVPALLRVGHVRVHRVGLAAHEVDRGHDVGLRPARAPPGRGVHADLVLPDVDGEPAAGAADVAGERGEERERAAREVAVVPVVGAAAHEDGGGLRRGVGAGDLDDQVRVDARDLRRPPRGSSGPAPRGPARSPGVAATTRAVRERDLSTCPRAPARRRRANPSRSVPTITGLTDARSQATNLVGRRRPATRSASRRRTPVSSRTSSAASVYVRMNSCVPRPVLDDLPAHREAERGVRAGLDPEVRVGLRRRWARSWGRRRRAGRRARARRR